MKKSSSSEEQITGVITSDAERQLSRLSVKVGVFLLASGVIEVTVRKLNGLSIT